MQTKRCYLVFNTFCLLPFSLSKMCSVSFYLSILRCSIFYIDFREDEPPNFDSVVYCCFSYVFYQNTIIWCDERAILVSISILAYHHLALFFLSFSISLYANQPTTLAYKMQNYLSFLFWLFKYSSIWRAHIIHT